MCCKNPKGNVSATDGGWYFEEDTIAATVALTKELMKKYNIPEANVIRHYDVTGKICPAPYVNNSAAWDDFKQRLTKEGEAEEMTQEQFNQMMDTYIVEQAKKPPENWSAQARAWAEDKKVINGDASGNKMYKKYLTREEAAQMLFNLLGKEGN